MTVTIEKKYIVVPINNHTTSKKLCFYEQTGNEKRLMMDFDCKIDTLNPQYLRRTASLQFHTYFSAGTSRVMAASNSCSDGGV